MSHSSRARVAHVSPLHPLSRTPPQSPNALHPTHPTVSTESLYAVRRLGIRSAEREKVVHRLEVARLATGRFGLPRTYEDHTKQVS